MDIVSSSVAGNKKSWQKNGNRKLGIQKNLAKNWSIRKLGNKNRVDIVSLSVVAGQPSACAPLITQTTAGVEQKQKGIRIQQKPFSTTIRLPLGFEGNNIINKLHNWEVVLSCHFVVCVRHHPDIESHHAVLLTTLLALPE